MQHKVAPDINISAMIIFFSTLLIPAGIYAYLRLRLIKTLFISAFRMLIQLAFMGLYLKYLFKLNSSLVNIVWLFIMIIFATYQAIKSSKLNLKLFWLPIMISYTLSIYSVTLSFNLLVTDINNIFSAKYLIVIGGMILGNSLRGVIVGISNFYENIIKEQDRVIYRMVTFVSEIEALLPYIKRSLELAVSPMLATMATMGIVSIPGMMTGQILGGVPPLVAIKYQMAIVIAIFVSINLTVFMAIFITKSFAFEKTGMIKPYVIRK